MYDKQIKEEPGIKDSDISLKTSKPSLVFSKSITCPECNSVNEPGVKVCVKCENTLMDICPNCQRETPKGTNTCIYCSSTTVKSKIKQKKDAVPPSSTENVIKPNEKKEETVKPSRKIKSLLFFIGMPTFLLFVFSTIGIWIYLWKHAEEKKQKIRIDVARKLGISVNVEKPRISKAQIKKNLTDQSSDINKEWEKQLPSFDEKKVEIAICKELSISRSMKKNPKLSIADLEKKASLQVEKKINEEIRTKLSPFPEKETKREIAQQMGFELPINPPAKPLKEIQKGITQDAVKKAKKKYSPEKLTKKIAEIKKKYQTHRVGDEVIVYDQKRRSYTGIYQGRIGNIIRIGKHKIKFIDIISSQKVKFSPSMSTKKAAAEIEKVKNSYNTKVQKFKKEYYEKNEKALLPKYGYKKENGIWKTNSEILTKKVNEAKNEFCRKQELEKEKIRKSVQDNFDKDKFIREYGYRKIDDNWYPENEVVAVLLKKRKDAFISERKEKLEQLKKDFYQKNGYVLTDDGWQAATDVLKQETQKALVAGNEHEKGKGEIVRKPGKQVASSLPEDLVKNEIASNSRPSSGDEPSPYVNKIADSHIGNKNIQPDEPIRNFSKGEIQLDINAAITKVKESKQLNNTIGIKTVEYINFCKNAFAPFAEKCITKLSAFDRMRIVWDMPGGWNQERNLHFHNKYATEKTLKSMLSSIDKSMIKKAAVDVGLKLDELRARDEVFLFFTFGTTVSQYISGPNKLHKKAYRKALNNINNDMVKRVFQLLGLNNEADALPILIIASGMCVNENGDFLQSRFENILQSVSDEKIDLVCNSKPGMKKRTAFLALFLTASQPSSEQIKNVRVNAEKKQLVSVGKKKTLFSFLPLTKDKDKCPGDTKVTMELNKKGELTAFATGFHLEVKDINIPVTGWVTCEIKGIGNNTNFNVSINGREVWKYKGNAESFAASKPIQLTDKERKNKTFSLVLCVGEGTLPVGGIQAFFVKEIPAPQKSGMHWKRMSKNPKGYPAKIISDNKIKVSMVENKIFSGSDPIKVKIKIAGKPVNMEKLTPGLLIKNNGKYMEWWILTKKYKKIGKDEFEFSLKIPAMELSKRPKGLTEAYLLFAESAPLFHMTNLGKEKIKCLGKIIEFKIKFMNIVFKGEYRAVE